MVDLTVTPEGQVTFRKDILNHLGVQPGDKITVEKLNDGKIIVRAMNSSGRISDAFGMLKRDGGPALSIEEINKFIAEAWAGNG